MPACVSCSTEPDPLWKYCVMCGTPVARPESRQPSAATLVPGAFRPRQGEATRRPPTIPRLATLVIVLAIIGVIASFFAAAAALS